MTENLDLFSWTTSEVFCLELSMDEVIPFPLCDGDFATSVFLGDPDLLSFNSSF